MPSSAPMSQWGTRWWCGVAVRVEVLDPHHHVVLFAGAVGGVGGRDVGDAQQQVAQLVGQRRGLGRRGPARARPSSRLSAWSASASSSWPSPAQRPDLLGQLLDPGPQLVALGGQRPLARVELAGPIERGLQVVATPGQRGRHRVEVGAQPADVEHGSKVPTPLAAARQGWPAWGPGRPGGSVAAGVHPRPLDPPRPSPLEPPSRCATWSSATATTWPSTTCQLRGGARAR